MSDKITQLTQAILEKNTSEVIALVKAGYYNNEPFTVDNWEYSSIIDIICCTFNKNNAELICTEIINTPNFDPGHNFGDISTPLIDACYRNYTNIALMLINTGKSNPHFRGEIGLTAIMWAIRNYMYQIAYILLTNNTKNSELNSQNQSFVKLLYPYHHCGLLTVEQIEELQQFTAELFAK